MRYRAFRHDGQFLDALHTTSGEFSVPAEQHAAGYAAKLGVESVEVVEGESDPRTGSLIEIPPDPQIPSPDPQGFMTAARDALGRDAAIDLANAYPSVLIALREGDYEIARYGIDRMQNDGVIDEETRQALHALMTAAGIPDPTE